MLLGIPRGARCVQRFDDSLNSAIHITYRISLRSSSMREPRDPLLKVIYRLMRSKSQLRSVDYEVYVKKVKDAEPHAFDGRERGEPLSFPMSARV
jgi:hypothetical protein